MVLEVVTASVQAALLSLLHVLSVQHKHTSNIACAPNTLMGLLHFIAHCGNRGSQKPPYYGYAVREVSMNSTSLYETN